MKKFIKKNKLYLLTFTISLFIISILFILNKVAPFGGKSLLCVDFFHQYGPMLGEFYDRIYGGKSLLYSFNMGLGLPFFRNFLNYMSSPFNLIILLFNRSNLLTSYSFVIGLKAVVSSCTLVFFLSRKFNTKSLLLIPLGVLYAFSAYFSAYYWNIMWTDGMVFLPLVVLGIEYIIKEHKWKTYTVWLAMMLISNYFIGYMVCIFSVLYFIIYSIYKTNFKDKNSIKYSLKGLLIFIGSSLLAGMIAGIFLIPMYYAISSISATGDQFPVSQYYKFTIEDFLKYHLSGVSTTTFASDPINAPNISTGIMSVGLFFLFILNKNISLKTKICYLCLILFFIVAFFWAPLDFILHAFHVPNDLPYRYSFLYVFTMIIIAAYALMNIKHSKIKTVISVYVGLMIILLLSFTSSWVGTTSGLILMNIIIITVCFIAYLIYHFKNKFKLILSIIMILVASTDVIITINYNWDISQIVSTFYYDYDDTRETLDYVSNLKNNKYYRIDRNSILTFNDPSWYNYKGMTTFSSMAYESMAKLQHRLGMPGNNINSYYYKQTTPVYDLMFNMAYFIGNNVDKKRYMSLEAANQDLNSFIYNIGYGYAVNDTLKTWEYKYEDPFAYQNNYIYKASGIENVFEELEPSNIEILEENGDEIVIKYIYTDLDDNIYFYNNDYQINYFAIDHELYYSRDEFADTNNINSEIDVFSINSYNEQYIINYEPLNGKVEVIISYESFYDNDFDYLINLFDVYTINNSKFLDAYNILRQHKLIITKSTEDQIEAKITLDDNMFVYTSIPYDEGWKVYVDGKQVETFKIGDSLLAFDAEKGSHLVKFKFTPKGLLPGILTSMTGIIILVTFTIISKRKNITK